MGNELIISIGRQLNIPGKVDNEWMCRVIYSIAGQMGLASLWDYDEDEDTVSIQHFKERIAEIFAAYEELYPSIKFIFPEKKSDLIDEIYHIYLRSGFFYHSAYRISPAVPSFATYNNLTICRGSSPDVQLFRSGLGYYSRQKSSADKSIAEVFGLQNQGLEDYLGGLLGDGEWVPIDWPDSAEFMYLGPSFRLGYWKQTPDKDGRISLARYGEPSKVYAFYRYYNGQYQQKAIPEWKTQDFSHSYPGSYGEHARIMSALLKSYDMLPPVRVSSAGDLVDIKIGYRLPPSEEDFFKLYSWPVRYDFPIIRSPQVFTRQMAKEVYPVFRHMLESIGYCFAEE